MGSYGGELKEEVRSLQPKPHVVLLAIPAPGHMFPNLALGRALARRGVKVMLLSTGVVSDKLRRDVGGDEEELDMTVGSVVEDPMVEPDTLMDLLPWLWKLSSDEMVEVTAGVIQRLSPPPCCFVTDLFLEWGPKLEAKLGIPRHYLITMSTATLSLLFSVPLFAKQGLLLVDRSSDVEFDAPGVGKVPKEDMWEYLTKGSLFQDDKPLIQNLQDLTGAFAAATYLVNSAEELEPQVSKAMKEPIRFTGEVHKVLPIGPLEIAFADKEGKLRLRRARSLQVKWKNGWTIDRTVPFCTLHSAPSSLSLSAEQILKIAQDVETSGQRFLWIIRPPMTPQIMVSKQPSKEEISALLPPGFEERTKGRGLLFSSWAPQPKILAHRAVGVFMSHCGWNSILETISTSTPVITVPCFLDQWMNATFVVEKLQIGIMVKNSEGGYERGRVEAAHHGHDGR